MEWFVLGLAILALGIPSIMMFLAVRKLAGPDGRIDKETTARLTQFVFRGRTGTVMAISHTLWWIFGVVAVAIGGTADAFDGSEHTVSNHGVITKVSAEMWWAMRILEPAGIAGFLIALWCIMIGVHRAAHEHTLPPTKPRCGLMILLITILGLAGVLAGSFSGGA